MQAFPAGLVYLVGGGPGDPGLITLRGIECLQAAQVVIHDRLVNRALLHYASQAQWIDVGKQPTHHPIPQDEINALLVQHARAGKVVVRLKGGDPFVFGRGGEEILALADAGIPFEVVPGVTSAIAAPAYAGIPLTHRGLACSAAVITGHRADCIADPASDWRKAANSADTLVFLMGVKNLEEIVRQLLAAGRAPETPVALVEQATTGAQKTVSGTLADIVERAREICPPAVIVVGQVVALREELRWFDRRAQRPLLGRRVLNLHTCEVPGSQAGLPFPRLDEFSLQLGRLGAEVIDLALRRVVPRDPDGTCEAILYSLAYGSGAARTASALSEPGGNGRRLPPYEWVVFTSPAAVKFFFKLWFERGLDARQLVAVKLAAIDLPTAQVLRQFGLVADGLLIHADQAEAELEPGAWRGRSVLLLHASGEAHALTGALQQAGAQVDCLALGQTQPVPPDPTGLARLLAGELEAAVFFSADEVEALHQVVEAAGYDFAQLLAPLQIVCASRAAHQALTALGLHEAVVAGSGAIQDVCATLQSYEGRLRIPGVPG